MQITLKKLAFMAAASAFIAPMSAFAQNTETTAAPAAENTAPAAPAAENTAPAAPAAENTAPAAPAAENTASAAPVAENTAPAAPVAENTAPAAPAAENTAPAAPAAENTAPAAPAAENTAQAEASKAESLPDTLASGKTSREARKNAMRGLANSYPVNGESTPQAAPVKPEAASETIKPRFIPAAAKTSERMPRFEHHGYFRTRLSAIGNYDLNTRGTSPVPAVIDDAQRGSSQQENIKMEEADALLGGNFRFRYAPTFHISETIRIAGSFDIMDNLVMGTTPNGLRTNWGSDAFFTFNGADPVNAETIGRNAITVKSIYGEADTIIGTFRAGRVPAHWGMGLVYNDGGVYNRETQVVEGHAWKCLDCDSSDAVDRVEWRIRDPFFDTLYLDFSWDFVNSGLASYNLQQDSIGQAFDLSDKDDVIQFTLSVFDRPLSQQEIDERYRDIFETRTWTADWGVLFSYRQQTIAPEMDAIVSGSGASSTYDMYEKDAEAYIVDLWGRFYIPCPHDITLRLEAELVGAFGSVGLDTGSEGKERDIIQIGGALEAEVWWKDLIAGLKFGAAWADNMVYSGHTMIESLDIVPMGSILRFDPNYTVDQIMFKELMGGINNAWYLNLNAEYKFPIQMPQLTTSLGARIDLTTSGPIVKEATPGNHFWYGFEGNLKVFYDESDRFRFEIGAGLFVPGDAWENQAKSDYPILPSQNVYSDSTSDTYDPEIAWNVLANLYFMF